MQDRFSSYQDIIANLETLFESMGLKTVLGNPQSSIDSKEQMPAITIQQSEDTIVERGTRKSLGYPAERDFNVVVDYYEEADRQINGADVTIIEKINIIRRTVLQHGLYGPYEGARAGVSIREDKIKGPFQLGIHNHIGVRLVFVLRYTDPGPGSL